MNSSFSSLNRADIIEQLAASQLDVLVIGGGITGCGIALDAAARGMKTGVIEMQDFAAGTSSRSTKLVHGGLRYLKQLQIRLVAEVGKERAIVYENGPHVTTPEWMLLPIHQGGTFSTFTTSIGLRVYDFLAGVKKGERRKMLTPGQTLAKEPLLKQQGLKGSGYYVEYRTDDARLTIEVIKEAAARGAVALNYAKASKLLYKNGKAVGLQAVDMLTGKVVDIAAKCIVNAAGPWVDTIREMDGSRKGKVLQLTKGIHLVFDSKRFPLRQAVYFDTPDKRMVFAIPRAGKTYVGTTDTVYKEQLEHPRMTLEDRDYIINAINFMFPDLNIAVFDVESSWAGVRPLIYEEGKDPSEISRKDEIWLSDSGLLTIAGGKLTGYRKMAELVVDKIAGLLQEQGMPAYPKSNTKEMKVSGGHVGGASDFESYVSLKADEGIEHGIPTTLAKKWAAMYGSNVELLFERYECYEDSAESSFLPVEIGVPLQYAIEEEMAVRPVDFFIRRTGAIFFNREWVVRWKLAVVQAMASRFCWSREQQKSFMEELEHELEASIVPENNAL